MIVSKMATLYSKTKCPKCVEGSLTKIGQMIRCTCGWWGYTEEKDDETPIQAIQVAQVIVS
jgi:hypothetical protein